MIKKIFMAAGIVAVGAWLWFGPLGSYIRTACQEGRTYLQKQVPDEFEIKRAKNMLASLDKEADKLISVMAREMTEIDRLQREVTEGEAWLQKARKDIQTANAELKSGRTVFVRSGFQYTREQFATDLERRFNLYKVRESTVQTKKESLQQRQQTLNATRDQLEALRAAKADLQARLEKLETDLRIVKAAEARSRHQVDNTQLAQVKALVDDLEKMVQSRKYEVQLREQQPSATPPATHSSPADLSQEIDSHFGTPAAEGSVAGT